MVSELNTKRCASCSAPKEWTPVVCQRERWIIRSHIDWKEERVSAKTLGAKGGWIVRFHIDWREEQVPTRTLGAGKE